MMSGSVGCAVTYPDSPPPASASRDRDAALARLGPQSVELSCCAPQTWYGKWFVTETWYICAVAYCCPVHAARRP
jgi:hypothetical protein